MFLDSKLSVPKLAKVAFSTLGLLAATCAANAEDNAGSCLTTSEIFRLPVFAALTAQQKIEAETKLIISEEKDLTAFCYQESCFVVFQCSIHPKVIDISRTVTGNLGRFGVDIAYDEIENVPLALSSIESEVPEKPFEKIIEYKDDPEIIGVLIRTRIWIGQQRYTASEKLLIRNSQPLYR